MNIRELEGKVNALHYQMMALESRVEILTPRPITELQKDEITALCRLIGLTTPIIGDLMTVADANATIRILRLVAREQQPRVIPLPVNGRRDR